MILAWQESLPGRRFSSPQGDVSHALFFDLNQSLEMRKFFFKKTCRKALTLSAIFIKFPPRCRSKG